MSSAVAPEDEPPEVRSSYVQQQPASAALPATDRDTLVIATSAPGVVLRAGQDGFGDQVSRFYSQHECEAAEFLLRLKANLRNLRTDDFWTAATEGMAELAGAQYAFISKRHRVDIEDPSRVLPPIGEPGSCLLGISIYYNDGKGFKHNSKDSQYIAYGSPCEYMKHDKVVLIPENLASLTPDNPNQLPEKPEAYLGIPLTYSPPDTDEEICFGHFGVMWGEEGAKHKKMSFARLETLLHTLEDLLVLRFQEFGYLDDLDKRSDSPIETRHSPAHHSPADYYRPVVTRSLKPYASSLSHELRTPMQGVVGMLDVMYAKVQEAAETVKDKRVRTVFRDLRENIELVQDSARRAVEAADNVVHAYDMDMSVPDPRPQTNEDEEFPVRPPLATTWSHLTPDQSLSPGRSHKRQRSSLDTGFDKPPKARRRSYHATATDETPARDSHSYDPTVFTPRSSTPQLDATPGGSVHGAEGSIAPGIRYTIIGDTIQTVINDALKTGGRPESAIAHPIDGGEEIEVRQKGPDGTERVKMVRWSVDNAVPETILIDERDFAGLLYRVLHNAFKFTDTGSITTTVRLSAKGKYILINIKDTGCGIPARFKPNLFKAFSKEDKSITRQSEGLGLGLMVAQGFARRLNGDLYAVRSETEGPNKGTEFEMRIPLVPGEGVSHPGTPYASRSPSSASRSVDPDHPIVHIKTPNSPRQNVLAVGTRHSRSSSLLARAPVTAASDPIFISPTTTLTHTLPPTILTPAPTVSAPSSALPTPTLPSILTLAPCHGGTPVRPASPNPLASRKLAHSLPLSFLVVEDNALLRKVLVQMLRNMGYVYIREAYDGADAVRQMEAHRARVLSGEASHEIDVILMDLWMPSMNGYQAAKHIISHSYGNEQGSSTARMSGWKTPVIISVTADVTDEAMESVAKSGMKGPLTKPYKQIDLERTLVEFCGTPAPAPVLMAGA